MREKGKKGTDLFSEKGDGFVFRLCQKRSNERDSRLNEIFALDHGSS
jgi:hypothetical protein